MKKWSQQEAQTVASLCLEIGAGLLENGAETSRVEETIRLTGLAFDAEVEAMVHPTGMSVGFGQGEAVTRVARIKERRIDLNKVAQLNRLSRQLQAERFSVDQARRQVGQIRRAPSLYGKTQDLWATGVACACLTAVVGGGYNEIAVAVMAGVISKKLVDEFANGFPTFLSLFALGFLSSLFAVGGGLTGMSREAIVVGSLLYQMPGLAFVSAARDLMAGELVAGNARLAEAILVTLGMASGVLACFGLFMRLGVISL